MFFALSVKRHNFEHLLFLDLNDSIWHLIRNDAFPYMRTYLQFPKKSTNSLNFQNFLSFSPFLFFLSACSCFLFSSPSLSSLVSRKSAHLHWFHQEPIIFIIVIFIFFFPFCWVGSWERVSGLWGFLKRSVRASNQGKYPSIIYMLCMLYLLDSISYMYSFIFNLNLWL